MTITYKIAPDVETAYIKGTGKVTADEILSTGATIFAKSEWANGFNILIDYRETTEFIAKTEDIEKIVNQDKTNESKFDRSKCAVVASSDLVYGYSRMWEALSANNKITTMVFRNIEDSLKWLGLNESVFHTFKQMP